MSEHPVADVQEWHDRQSPHEHPADGFSPFTTRMILRMAIIRIMRNIIPIDIHCMMRFVVIWRF